MADDKNPFDSTQFIEGPMTFGRFPVRQELSILPADTPTKGWTIENEYVGCEVYLLDGEDNPIEEPLTYKSALAEGTRIYAPTLVGAYLATVCKGEDGLFWDTQPGGEAAGTQGDLEFDQDKRHCWVTTMALNKRALASFNKVEPPPSEETQ